MARLSRRRGSVAVLAMIMLVSTISLAMVLVSLSGGTRTKQTRLEAYKVVQAAFDGGVDTVHDMASRGVLRMPQTVNLTIGNVQESLTLTDASTGGASLLGLIQLSPTVPLILIDGNLTYKGQVYHYQKVIGRGLLSTVWQYALYDNTALNDSDSVVTSVPGYLGDAWFNGAVNLTNSGTYFAGDLTSTGTINPGTINVSGAKTPNSPSITFPAVDHNKYQPVAITQLADNATLSGYAFPAVTSSGYAVIYENGPMTLDGGFSGSGVVYCEGNMTIDADVTCGLKDHLVIIGHGNITVAAGVNSIQAYIFCGGTLTLSASANTLLVRGGIVTKNLSLGRNLQTGFDPIVRDNPVEAYNLKLPGVWP